MDNAENKAKAKVVKAIRLLPSKLFLLGQRCYDLMELQMIQGK